MPRTTNTSINWIAVSLGGAAGFLSAALFALLLWVPFNLLKIGEPVTGAILGGVLGGLVVAGYVAGRVGHRAVFHGALTAVLAGGAITLLALGEGSPAPPVTMAGFIGGSAVLGGLGGWAAERSKRSRRSESE